MKVKYLPKESLVINRLVALFTLPHSADSGKIEARYESGILKVIYSKERGGKNRNLVG